MKLLSLPTQSSLSNYCTVHTYSHWSGYVLWGEFTVNLDHNRFIRLIPEINNASLFGINPTYYASWVSNPNLKVIYSVTS